METTELHFHFTQNIQVAQIQLFAKIVKCMMADQYSDDYSNLIIHWEFPQEVQTIKELEALCVDHRKDEIFFVSTPKYHNLEYVRHGTTQIPNLTTNIYLAKLQEKYNNFKQDKFDTSYVKMVDEMMCAFNGINTDLSFLFMNSADEEGTFTWHGNYSPCFFDRGTISELRGRVCDIAIKEHYGETISWQMHDIARSLLMNYLYQCGYLAFWSCLSDMATFPGITPQEQEVLDNLATYLLNNYANIYVYYLSVENKPLGGCNHIDKRGSAENTTRIKLYFTKEDTEPVLLRLDLPHEGCHCVHLNIEEGGENKHNPLSKEVVGSEYDHVFDSLSDALLLYDFNAADYVHSPVAEDKRIIKDMRYRTALLTYAPHAFYYQELGSNVTSSNYDFVKQARNVLIELLETDNFKRDELLQLTPPDLLEMAYKELL